MTSTPWTRRHALKTVAAAGGVASTPLWAQSNDAASPASAALIGNSKEIRIGQSGHLTGPYAPTFLPVVEGQKLAIEDFNRKGGVRGRPVRLLILDDAYDPKRTVENYQQLIDKEKVVALFGVASTPAALAAFPLLMEKKVPLVCSYSGSPALRVKQHPYFFTTMASYRDEVNKMVAQLVTVQKPNIGIVYQNSPFGLLMKPYLEEAAKASGATLVSQQMIEGNGSNAVDCVNAMAASKPQALMLINFGPSMVPLIRAAKAQLGVPIYCLSIANAPLMLKELGDDARGLAFAYISPFPYRQTSTLTRDFAAAMGRLKKDIHVSYMWGYANMTVLLEGLRRSGKNLTPASIVKGMESMSKLDLGSGYVLNYGPNKHHGSSFVDITIVGPNERYIY